MENCAACGHPMHPEQCTHTAAIPTDGVDTICRCECPVGVTAQIFHGQLLSQISGQLQALIQIELDNQQNFRLILQGMAKAAGVGNRIITH